MENLGEINLPDNLPPEAIRNDESYGVDGKPLTYENRR